MGSWTARTAEIVIAEIGVDMTRLPTAAHLCSWAGVCPGTNESAGKTRPASRHGNPWLISALVETGWAATAPVAATCRPGSGGSPNDEVNKRAPIAIAHNLLTIFWWMLTERLAYHEIGPGYLAEHDRPDRRRRQLVDQLKRLGYHVDLTPAA
jgi:hypothetical protein